MSVKRALRIVCTSNDVVDCEALAQALEPMTKLCKVGFDWNIMAYGKHRRSQGSDLQGLQTYKPLTKMLATFAPKSFPPLVTLRSVCCELDRKHNLKPQDGQSQEVWASGCADRLRFMMKHLVDIKKSSSSWLKIGLEDVLALLDTEEPSKLLLPSSRPPWPPQPRPSRMLRLSKSDASSCSVQVCGIVCNCPECVLAMEILSETDSIDVEAASTSVVPPRPGAVAKIVALRKRPAAAADPRGHWKIVRRATPPVRAEAYLFFKKICGGIASEAT